MTAAICFKCGWRKSNALGECLACTVKPEAEYERALSLVLSTHLSPPESLEEFGREIASGWRLSIPTGLLKDAKRILADPAVLDQLLQGAVSGDDAVSQAATAASIAGKDSALSRNPFWVLRATPRMKRQELLNQAEELSLVGDEQQIAEAKAVLTAPVPRLDAEVSWFPGVAPKKAEALMGRLVQLDSGLAKSAISLPPLARCNLISAVFETQGLPGDVDSAAGAIMGFISAAEDIEPDAVLSEINEDRLVAGISDVQSVDVVAAALKNLSRGYRQAIVDALSKLPTLEMVAVITKVAERLTDVGSHYGTGLLDDLIDEYEVLTTEFLTKESDNIREIMAEIERAAGDGEGAVSDLANELLRMTKAWDDVAQPIQVNAKARGVRHELSTELAHDIRSMTISLVNEHGLVDVAKRITDALSELFAELPELADQLAVDTVALEGIAEQRKQSAEEKRQWAEDIKFRTTIGLIFRDDLVLSENGVEWKGRRYPLDSIIAVRWGGVRDGSGGGQFTYAFETKEGGWHGISMSDERKFDDFATKMWRAVGFDLLLVYLDGLRNGESYQFGRLTVRDTGVSIESHSFRGSSREDRRWADLQWGSHSGSFLIAARDDKRLSVVLSYLEVPNLHVLARALEFARSKGPFTKLSQVFGK